MAVLLTICTIILIICVIKWFFRDKALYEFADKIPGPKSYAVIGSSHKLLKKTDIERFQIVRGILEKYQHNPMTRFWLGPALFIFINDPNLIEKVLNAPECVEKSFLYEFLRLNKGLLAAKHDTWQEHRKFLEPCFQHDVIKSFTQIFIDSSDKMLESLSNIEDKSNVDLFKIVSRCSLTMVLASSFGLSAAEVHFDDEILKAVEELIKIISKRCHEPMLYIEPVYRMTRSYYREKKYRKRCYYFLDQVLKERREIIAPHNNNSTDGASTSRYQKDEELGEPNTESKNFIDQLILHDKQFNDEEIHDHIYTFVAAGYETTALQITFTLLLLAMHPDVQETLFKEVFEAFSDNSTRIDYEYLKKLEYLDAVVKESMRLLPPVPLIGRQTLEEIELNELKVPKGVTLLINFFNLHRRKDLWGADAEIFKPERFLIKTYSEVHPHSFLPFSRGTRDCIGHHYALLAIKTVLFKFLRAYKVNTDLKYQDLIYKADLTLKICNELEMSIEKR